MVSEAHRRYEDGRDRTVRKYTAVEVKLIVHITVDLNPTMIMWQALELLRLNLAEKYVDDLDFRAKVDVWYKTQFAGLSLTEFLSGLDK